MFQFSAFLRAAFAMRAVNPIVETSEKTKIERTARQTFRPESASGRFPSRVSYIWLKREEATNREFKYSISLWENTHLRGIGAACHVFSMIFKFFFSPFFLPLCTIYVKKHGRAYGKKWAQERGTDTQWGRRAGTNMEPSGGIWDFRRWLCSRKRRFSSWRTFNSSVVSLHARCLGKCFRSLGHEENESEINLITSRGRPGEAVHGKKRRSYTKTADVGHHQTSGRCSSEIIVLYW